MFARLRASYAELSSGYRSTAKVSLWLPVAVVLTFVVLEGFNPFGTSQYPDVRVSTCARGAACVHGVARHRP